MARGAAPRAVVADPDAGDAASAARGWAGAGRGAVGAGAAADRGAGIPLFQYDEPGESCLKCFQYEKLEMFDIVMNRCAPFGVVILPHQIVGFRPGAAAVLIFCCLGLYGSHLRTDFRVGKQRIERRADYKVVYSVFFIRCMGFCFIAGPESDARYFVPSAYRYTVGRESPSTDFRFGFE